MYYTVIENGKLSTNASAPTKVKIHLHSGNIILAAAARSPMQHLRLNP